MCFSTVNSIKPPGNHTRWSTVTAPREEVRSKNKNSSTTHKKGPLLAGATQPAMASVAGKTVAGNGRRTGAVRGQDSDWRSAPGAACWITCKRAEAGSPKSPCARLMAQRYGHQFWGCIRRQSNKVAKLTSTNKATGLSKTEPAHHLEVPLHLEDRGGEISKDRHVTRSPE